MATPDRDETTRATVVRVLSSPGGRLGVTVGPGGTWIVLLLLAPLTFMVVVSFLEVSSQTYQILAEPTLDNYRALFAGQGPIWQTPFFKALWLSYAIATVSTLLCLVLAFPLAYLLARRGGRVFKVVIFLVLLPFFTMYLVRAYSWVLMFGPGGVINSTLLTIGLVDEPLELFNYGILATVVGLTHAYFPYMLLTLYASLDGLDFSLVEAARDLGASRVEVVRDHIVPLTAPGIVGGSLFVFVPSVGAFITPRFLAQGKLQMIGILIENRVNGTYSIGYASAASMFVLVSIVAAMVLAFRYVSIEDLGGA
ncbi:ABC transporter permease [Salinilacihabitans rarus]|uniref:ABC transporter permease n=1 Tax=Salinilacihabitans rarus TaxID=2961596 RepID=UPI0020C89159|nr:ABC transporter permease [Salinilacihabitans rarus]